MGRFHKQAETKIIHIAGAGTGHGCTHLAINLAASLHASGYRTAIMEDNMKRDFECIADEYGCQIDNYGCFNYLGVDYFMYRRPRVLPLLYQKGYHYIIVDHGEYSQCDKDFFLSGGTAVISCSSRPWQINDLEIIFSEIEDESILEALHYCFHFASSNKNLQKQIRTEMGNLKNVCFLEYTENPFKDYSKTALTNILDITISSDETLHSKMPLSSKKSIFGNRHFRMIETQDNHENIKNIQEIEKEEIKQDTDIQIKEDIPIFTSEITASDIESGESSSIILSMPELKSPENEKEIHHKESDTEKTPVGTNNETPEEAPETKIEENVEVSADIQEEVSEQSNNEIIYLNHTREQCMELFLSIRNTNSFLVKTEFKESFSDNQQQMLITSFANRQTACAFDGLLRALVPHTRENGKDESPVIRINENEGQFEIREEILRAVAEEDAEYLIYPEKDNYIKI